MPKAKLYNIKGDILGDVELNASHFDVKPSLQLIHEVTVAQNANKRSPIANTKTKGEVSGGGKKPWKQKGTGRARQGSTRNPQWVGGGVAFGPRSNRNFSVKINRKAKRKALFMVLTDRLQSDMLLVVDKFPTNNPKTSELMNWMKNLKTGRRSLVIMSDKKQELIRMAKNLKNVHVIGVNSLQAADLIKYPTIIFEQSSLPVFEALYKS
jgi:large subunit ribosomal protein L4